MFFTSTPVLTSFRNGLGAGEAATRLAANGPNRLKDGKKVSVFEILLRQVSNSLTFVLAIVMVLSFSLGDWIEGAVVAAVVLVNVVVGYDAIAHQPKYRSFVNMRQFCARLQGRTERFVSASPVKPGVQRHPRLHHPVCPSGDTRCR